MKSLVKIIVYGVLIAVVFTLSASMLVNIRDKLTGAVDEILPPVDGSQAGDTDTDTDTGNGNGNTNTGNNGGSSAGNNSGSNTGDTATPSECDHSETKVVYDYVYDNNYNRLEGVHQRALSCSGCLETVSDWTVEDHDLQIDVKLSLNGEKHLISRLCVCGYRENVEEPHIFVNGFCTVCLRPQN